MNRILELAESLGKAIADSPQSQALRAARQEMHKESGLEAALKDYHAQADKIAELEEANKPIEVGEKHRLQALHDTLVASAAFKRYTAAQVEYIDLMRQVNETLGRQLAATEEPPAQA